MNHFRIPIALIAVMSFVALATVTGIRHRIDQSICDQCGLCVDECPEKAIKVVKQGKKEIHVIDDEKCNQCGLCVESCPVAAIKIEKVDGAGALSDKAPAAENTKKKKGK
jgi:ferredoxin